MNIVGLILYHAKTRATAPALAADGHVLSYGDLAGLVQRTARHMAGLGWQPGERIGLCLKDTPQHIVALLAAAHVGALPVPLDWRARPAENAGFSAALGLRCLLVEPDATHTGDCPSVPLDERWHRQVAGLDAHGDHAGEGSADWNDPFVISATSGSTGAPKFTVMTHLQYHFASAGMQELMALTGRHRFLCTLPLYYSAGRNSCITHLLRGDCVVMYPSLFSAAEYVDVVRRENITVAALVPSVVRQLLAASAGTTSLLPGLTALFCSGSPLYAEEKRRAVINLTPNFCERYGTAETMAVALLRPEDFAGRADSVGQPHSFAEIEVVDEEGHPLPSGGIGRLRIRGPGVGSPLPGHGTAASFGGGWYYPGEIARIDEAGYIFLRGRTSDVIMRSGAKVYPAEIETVLIEHRGVLEAAVIGFPEANHEESVIAFVVPKSPISAGELLAHCRARLSAHKVPRQIRFLAHLPKNTAGKIDKIALTNSLTTSRL